MSLLAERVVDILEQRNKEQYKSIVESEEYIKFEEQYTDEFVEKMRTDLNELARLERLRAHAEEQRDFLRTKLHELGVKNTAPNSVNYYRYTDPVVFLDAYLKEKKKSKFEVETFERDKMIRKVQTDMLLADTGNAEALIESLVNKY